MDGPRDYHTMRSESERERQIPYDITYMWNLKYDANEHTLQKQTQIQRTDLWLPRGREVEEGRIGSLGLADSNYYIQDG